MPEKQTIQPINGQMNWRDGSQKKSKWPIKMWKQVQLSQPWQKCQWKLHWDFSGYHQENRSQQSWWGHNKREACIHYCQECKQCNHYGNIMEGSQKQPITALTYEWAMPLLSIYSEEYMSPCDRDICTPMLSTALFTAAKIRMSLKVHQWMTR